MLPALGRVWKICKECNHLRMCGFYGDLDRKIGLLGDLYRKRKEYDR